MSRFNANHLLAIADLSAADLTDLLDLAARIKADPRNPEYAQALNGKTLGLLFDKASTRTRISFEVAMNQLGGNALMISRQDSQLGRGESIPDSARVMSRFLDGLMIRTFGHDILTEWAENASIPIINGLTDLAHPCQALADLQTVQERFGSLKGRGIAYVGDGNNVTHSLMVAGALAGMDVRVATPKGYEPDPEMTRITQQAAAQNGGRFRLTTDPAQAVAGVHAVYTDVWASMGQEQEQAQREKDFAGYQVDAALMALAADDAMFLHCLPAHRGEEVSAEVMDGPQSAVFDQAENRLHAQKAVLYRLLCSAA